MVILAGIIRFWVPKAALDYLNRPDTGLRQKLSQSLSEMLGEPAQVAFKISDVKLNAVLNLEIDLSDINIVSPTLSKLNATIQSAKFVVPLRESFIERKIIMETIRIHIPSLSIEPEKDGSWPLKKIFEKREADSHALPPGGGNAGEGVVIVRSVELVVDLLRVRQKTSWEEFSGLNFHANQNAPYSVREVDLSVKKINGIEIGLNASGGADTKNMSFWSGIASAGPIDLETIFGILRRQGISEIENINGNLKGTLYWTIYKDTIILDLYSAGLSNFKYPANGSTLTLPDLDVKGTMGFARGQPPLLSTLFLGKGPDHLTLSGFLAMPLNLHIQTKYLDLDKMGLGPVLAARMPQIRIQRPRVRLDVGVTGQPDRPRVDGTFALISDRLVFRGVPIIAPEVSGRMTPSDMQGKLQGKLFSGELSGRFAGPADGSVIDLSGKLSGADISEINSFLPKKDVRLSGQAFVDADLKQVSENLKRMSGTVTLSGKSVGISGLPTFNSLAQSLNEIAAALEKIGQGL